MLSYMNYSDRTKFRKKYIYPLLDAGIIQMTIPNKPNSRNQKYQLTAKGLELTEHLKSNKQRFRLKIHGYISVLSFPDFTSD